MKIYTKGGDKGSTSLIGGERVPKDDPRVNAYGTVDELGAFLSHLRDTMASDDRFEAQREQIKQILLTLMGVSALLAQGRDSKREVDDISDAEIELLEASIDAMGAHLEPITSFTVPGGAPLISLSHICRTVCRRAERASAAVVRINPKAERATIYLNRLSDYLYQLGRYFGHVLGVKEEYWKPR